MADNKLTVANRVEIDLEKTPEQIASIQKQAAKLVKIVVTAYPNSDKFPNGEAVANTVNLWANYFADDDWRIVALAVSQHVATNKWPPSIAEIRERIADLTRPDLAPPDEAWRLVSEWMHNTSEYGDDSADIFPAIIAETIKACGGKSGLWALLRQQYGYSGKAGLDKLTFMQLYEPRYQRERQRAMMPGSINDGIEMLHRHLNNPEYQKLEAGRQRIAGLAEEKRRLHDQMHDDSMRRMQALVESRQKEFDSLLQDGDRQEE